MYLQIHNQKLEENEEMRERMEEVMEELNSGARELDTDMKLSLCLGKYTCSAKLAWFIDAKFVNTIENSFPTRLSCISSNGEIEFRQ